MYRLCMQAPCVEIVPSRWVLERIAEGVQAAQAIHARRYQEKAGQ